MKQNIFSLLVQKKSYNLKKLETLSKLKRLKVFLPLSLQENLVFIVVKNNKLLFAFKELWACKEFNQQFVKEISHFLATQGHAYGFSGLGLLEIQAYVPKDLLEKADFYAPIKKQAQFYYPSALGVFHNPIKDTHLYECFEKVRSLIGYQRSFFEK
ncbi:hypothetical protein [Helicobacter cetorum]|uniref:Uncharacterized protein n=1 Tax=Helicobacter cetorum (strain ATCC BAA-540 / CCUG 52418 / MIT 99-5656) TaxID=1163745 RepID=I0ET87_HELCM|nr:hypothetical protein [Helicobacter cetorum]AFI06156.1 hypothetical protein HCD_05770 [Helicobacter cetorum MIT 99-5656]